MSRRTGCPNIGHATGSGVLTDGRTGPQSIACRGRDMSRRVDEENNRIE
ncbi:hypothetical protein [Evansella tamaricis]|uniref:Uncharacterized protein n=1 Tax=Evansella tamaricis TaxID=2069301 RepID=A0ABS6JKG1_9BACI|nr:hypothetical protein [Evansella tamaricis]MBU9714133.1 hypothetical protein [Evansella tamaricis]